MPASASRQDGNIIGQVPQWNTPITSLFFISIFLVCILGFSAFVAILIEIKARNVCKEGFHIWSKLLIGTKSNNAKYWTFLTKENSHK